MTSTAEADELTPLAERIAELVAARGLTLIPATPTTNGPTVHLEPEDLPVEAFLDLAVTTGQHLVYLEAEPFDGVEFAELDTVAADTDADDDARRQASSLRDKAAQYAGRPISLEAVFVSQGVVHRWCAQARWFDDLEEELSRPHCPRPGARAGTVGGRGEGHKRTSDRRTGGPAGVPRRQQ